MVTTAENISGRMVLIALPETEVWLEWAILKN